MIQVSSDFNFQSLYQGLGDSRIFGRKTGHIVGQAGDMIAIAAEEIGHWRHVTVVRGIRKIFLWRDVRFDSIDNLQFGRIR